jgi:hypothetical protein
VNSEKWNRDAEIAAEETTINTWYKDRRLYHNQIMPLGTLISADAWHNNNALLPQVIDRTRQSSKQSRLSFRLYQVREKMISIGDNFKIIDERGKDMFIVKSKICHIGNHLVLEDLHEK